MNQEVEQDSEAGSDREEREFIKEKIMYPERESDAGIEIVIGEILKSLTPDEIKMILSISLQQREDSERYADVQFTNFDHKHISYSRQSKAYKEEGDETLNSETKPGVAFEAKLWEDEGQHVRPDPRETGQLNTDDFN